MSAVYLKHIEVKGLFGYKDISWEVFRDVNILGGDNGSGKSTIFHLCHLLLGYGYVTEPHYAYLADSVTLTFDNGWRMFWDKQLISRDSDREGGYTYHNIETNKVEKDGTFQVQRVRIVDEEGRIGSLDDFVNIVRTAFASSFEQNILEVQRPQGDKKQPNDDKTYLDMLLTSCIAMRNERVTQIFYNYLTQISEKKEDGEENANLGISQKDRQYLAAFGDALMTFFGKDYEIKTGMEAKISFVHKKSGKLIKYQDLSLGEKQVLFLIVMTSNMYDEPVLLWLDEPDLGLHVDWQEQLISALQLLYPNMQVFVSTHAPSMIVGNQERVVEMSEIETERHGQ